jgi:class 3 adenylate cyclase/tetratricopeptide (TPR) repeat protein
MQCPACKQDTPSGARFCPSCGGPLAPPAGVDSPPAPQRYTPRHLADKILTTRSALEGERKQVTVLFADVSGFTRFSDRRDPEEVHRVMTRALELMLESVHRYEGTVNQFLGDGIMALFGAPIAHEDHTHRALHAALDIRRALEVYREELRASGLDFQVRQGLNTGTVVVGSIGNDLRMDYTAVGDTTNVAARLVQAADPGRIVISAPVQRQTEGYFYTRPLGELTLKGKAEPTPAWELVGARQARTRLEVQAEHGLAPFVGRDRELSLLQELFARARGGHGQIAFVAGEPGIGKSRLLFELRQRLGGEATWLEGHASSVGRGAAFHPLVDLMKRNFRIEDGDSEEAAVRKIERGVLLLGEDLRPTLPYFRLLLSLGTGEALAGIEPKQQRANLFDAVRRLIVRAAGIHPQVFVIEDLHWMDDATEAFLVAAADTIPTNRVLCILTYRSNYAHRLGEQPHHTTIPLDTLSEEHSAQIARWILAADLLPGEVAALVTRVAEGNPFFVEEVVKTLREQGAVRAGAGEGLQVRGLQHVVIPDTVQSLIAARIDRLDDATKRTLQAAAVIGRRFPLALLAAAVDDEARAQAAAHAETLAKLDFIARSRAGADPEYSFKHALTQDVAYESLLQQRRRQLHGRVAAAMEAAGRELVEEQLPLLAHHYARSADQDKAIEYLLRAGDQAVRLYANAAAKLHFAEALARLQRLGAAPARDELLVDVTIRLCGVSDTAAEFAQDLERLNAALALARSIGDRARESRLLYWLGRTFYTTGQTTKGAEPAERALAIADELGDEKLAALPVNLLGRLYFLSDFKKACPMLERSMRLIDPANRIEIALARGGLGWSQAMIGRFERALDSVNGALTLAQETGHVPTLAGCHMYLGCALAPRGRWPEATSAMREALALAQKTGDHFRIYLTTGFLGGYLVMQGQHGQGLELLDRMIAMAQKIGTRLGLHNAYVYIGESQLQQGRAAEAAETAQKAITLAVETQQRWTEGWARRVLGEALAASAGAMAPQAEKELRESVRILEDLGTLPDLARALFAYGALLGSASRTQEGAPPVARARSMFADMGMSWDLQRATSALASRSAAGA